MTRGGPGHRLGCLWLSPVLAAIQRSLGQPESWPGCAPVPAACRDLDAGLGFLGPWFLRWEERWAGGWRKPLCQLWCRTYSAGTAPSLSSLEAGSLSLAGRETEVQPMPTQRWQGRGWAQGWPGVQVPSVLCHHGCGHRFLGCWLRVSSPWLKRRDCGSQWIPDFSCVLSCRWATW